MVSKLITGMNKHIENNFWLYIISLLCICTGIVLGIYAVRYMGSFEKSDLLSYINNFTNVINKEGINSKAILFETIKNNMLLIIGVWFLGLTMIGIPAILIIDIIKGFTIGFTTCFVVNGMGVKGLWVTLLGVLPQNIIYIPCIMFASVLAMEFSIHLLNDKGNIRVKNSIWVKISSYSFSFVFVVCIMFIGFVLESYVTPNMIKLVVERTGSLLV
ncbi:stage II sporulation protein M [Clostridium oceanicum]|uniref:Stage II sporulation protein M n=1 Tax=Clostridium oceanicum TaxID=1543 RepID=A0ABN1JNH9_9CLOT